MKTNPNTTHSYPHTCPTPSLPHPSLSPNGWTTPWVFFSFFFSPSFVLYLFIYSLTYLSLSHSTLPCIHPHSIILYHDTTLHVVYPTTHHTSHVYPHTSTFAATNLNHVRQNGIHLSVPSLEDHSHCFDMNTYSTRWTQYYIRSLTSTIGLCPNRRKTGFF
jgi:hypothetical protein